MAFFDSNLRGKNIHVQYLIIFFGYELNLNIERVLLRMTLQHVFSCEKINGTHVNIIIDASNSIATDVVNERGMTCYF